jgi:hypothetical protein
MKKLLWGIVIASASFLPLVSLAQDDVQATQEEAVAHQSGMVVVAEVDITEARIVKQDSHHFDIEFILSNGQGAQADVRYAIRLVRNDKELGQSTVYQTVYNQPIALSENSSLVKQISWDVPEYLSGEYEMWLIAQNGDGLPLSGSMPGTVKLEGTNQYIDIDRPSCSLFIKDLPENYALLQGVDISAQEHLMLSCSIKNLYDHAMVLHPSIATYARTELGDAVDAPAINDVINLNPGESKTVVIEIPTQKKPQAYNIVMTFLDEANSSVSGPINAHYVVQGESATILSVQLDKTSYASQENIITTMMLAGSADRFLDARGEGTMNAALYYNLSIADENGNLCATPITHVAFDQKESQIVAKLKAIRACANPKVTVSVENDQQATLAQQEQAFKGDKKESSESNLASSISFKTVVWSVVAILTIIGVLIIIYIYKRRATLMIAFFLIAGSVMYGGSAEGKTLSTTGIGGETVSCAFDLSNYSPSTGATIKGTVSSCVVAYCGNGFQAAASLNNVVLMSYNPPQKAKALYTEYPTGGSTNISVTAAPGTTVNVPISVWSNHKFDYYSSCANYKNGKKGFWFDAVWCSSQAFGVLPYTVPQVVVNGACGGANGATYATLPSIGLCSAGSVNNQTTGEWGWSWACNGTGGGTQAWCSAYKSAAPTCQLYFSPTSITAPGDATVTLATTNATSTYHTCTGPSADPNNHTMPSLNGTWAQHFDQAGTKDCNMTVYGPGGQSTCHGAITVSAQATYSCTGGNPPSGALWCTGDDTGLTANTAWQQVTSCSNTRKCEYTTPTYSCSGGSSYPPSGASWCPGDDIGLTANTDWTQVTSCTSAQKCEYTMPAPTGACACGSAAHTGYPSTTNSLSPPLMCAAGTEWYVNGNTFVPNDTNKWYCINGAGKTCTGGSAIPSIGVNGVYCEATRIPSGPTLDFTASQTTIVSGTSSTLNWTTSPDVTSCWAESPSGWQGWKTNTGGNQGVSPTTTTTYDLECWNDAHVSTGKKTVTITVTPPPCIPNDCSNKADVCSGIKFSNGCVPDGCTGTKIEDPCASSTCIGSKCTYCDASGTHTEDGTKDCRDNNWKEVSPN